MSTETIKTTALKGGEFLIRDVEAQDIFIPEDWNEEQVMIAEMCRGFPEAKRRQ